jgi:hypothetical protein
MVILAKDVEKRGILRDGVMSAVALCLAVFVKALISSPYRVSELLGWK